MMARRGGEAIAGARDGHLGRLQCGVVCGGMAAVVGQLVDGGVFKIALDERAQIVEFSFAGRVGLHPAGRLQFFPSHPVKPRW